MFILMVFNDYDEEELIYIGFFNLIKDILEYTNHIIKYSKEQIRHNYNNNKERINKKIECECGRIIIKRMIKKHLKTDIHDKCLFIKNNNIQIENNNNNENEKKLHNGIVIFK